eukprot:3268215-Pleurochrysis_carterae.AAC.1
MDDSVCLGAGLILKDDARQENGASVGVFDCKSMGSGEDSMLGLAKDRGATVLKITSWSSCLRVRAGVLRQRLRQRHGVERRPAWIAMGFFEQRLPNRTK